MATASNARKEAIYDAEVEFRKYLNGPLKALVDLAFIEGYNLALKTLDPKRKDLALREKVGLTLGDKSYDHKLDAAFLKKQIGQFQDRMMVLMDDRVKAARSRNRGTAGTASGEQSAQAGPAAAGRPAFIVDQAVRFFSQANLGPSQPGNLESTPLNRALNLTTGQTQFAATATVQNLINLYARVNNLFYNQNGQMKLMDRQLWALGRNLTRGSSNAVFSNIYNVNEDGSPNRDLDETGAFVRASDGSMRKAVALNRTPDGQFYLSLGGTSALAGFIRVSEDDTLNAGVNDEVIAMSNEDYGVTARAAATYKDKALQAASTRASAAYKANPPNPGEIDAAEQDYAAVLRQLTGDARR